MFAPLPKLPERSRGQLLREAIPADYLNAIAASIAELDRRTRALAPVASPDLVPATGPGGTTYALRRRTRAAAAAGHPWKATATGTANIAIAPGCVVGYRPAPETNDDSPMRFPIVGEHVPFLGDEIEITAAAGSVYAHLVAPPGVVESQQTSFSYQGDLQEMWIHRSILYLPEVIELAFIPADTVPEEGGIYIPIATVLLADGIASVDYQILTHNPHIQLDGHSIDLDVESA